MKKGDIEFFLQQARDGVYGTPDRPNRSRFGNDDFWNVYFGRYNAREYRGTIIYAKCCAAELYREELKKGEKS